MQTVEHTLQSDSEVIRREHHELMVQLDRLDAALDKIVCYSEIFCDLAKANQVLSRGNWVAEWLPGHNAYEETSVLDTIAQMSPDLASFAREMKQQHIEIRVRLGAFRQHIEQLAQKRDLETAVADLKEEGKRLTRMIRRHMAAEENKLAGLKD